MIVVRFDLNWLFAAFFLLLSSQSAAGSQNSTQKVLAALQPGCSFTAILPEKAKLSVGQEGRSSASIMVENPRNLKTDRYIEPFYLGFSCDNADDGHVTKGWARPSTNGKTWLLNLDPVEKKRTQKVLHFHSIQAVNASGWAVTIDDSIGEERGRHRQIHYCLVRSPKAICGDSDMGLLQDIKKDSRADLTSRALQILQSVEFLPENYKSESVVADNPSSLGVNRQTSAGENRDLYIPNVLTGEKPCHIQIEDPLGYCDEKGCVITPAPRKSTLAALEVRFACVPMTANTEFTNPPPEWKVFTVETKTSKIDYMFFDNLVDAKVSHEVAKKHITFCLMGKDSDSQLCGEADVLILSDGKKNDLTQDVLKILKKISLIN